MSRVGVTLGTAGVDCKGDLLNGQGVVPVGFALFKLIVTGDFMLDVVLCERQEAFVSGIVPGGNVDSLGDQVLDPRLRVNSRNVVCLQKLINLGGSDLEGRCDSLAVGVRGWACRDACSGKSQGGVDGVHSVHLEWLVRGCCCCCFCCREETVRSRGRASDIYMAFLRATKHRLHRKNDRDTVSSQRRRFWNLVTG